MMNKAKGLLDILNKYQPIFIAGVVAVLILLPHMGLGSYMLRIIIMIGIYSILAMGLNILTGYTGLVSLGNAAYFSIGAYTSAILSTRVEGFTPNLVASFIAGGIVAAFIGLLIAIPTLRLTGSYLSLVTLGFGEITRSILLNWDKVTNGPLGIKGIPAPTLFGVQFTLRNNGLYYLMIILVLLVSLFVYLIVHSKTGRAFVAIREDELAATMMGIKTTRYKVLAFVLSAFISGIAGSFYAHMIGFIEPNSFTFDTSILIISIVILGGMGTMRGMYLGAILLISFPEVLRFLEGYRFVVYGLILVVMMRFRPQGLLGWASSSPYKYPKLAKNKQKTSSA